MNDMNNPRRIGEILDEDDVVSWALYNTVIKEYLKKEIHLSVIWQISPVFQKVQFTVL